MVRTNNDFLFAPAACEIGCQLTANLLVQIQKELLINGPGIPATIPDGVLNRFHASSQMRRELGIAQDAECGIEMASGCVRRLSSASSIA